MKLWTVSYYIAEGGQNKAPPFQYILAEDFRQAFEKAETGEDEVLKLAKIELSVMKIEKA